MAEKYLNCILFKTNKTQLMQIDILGKVREKKLPYNNTLLPLYEAVVNSIHAIEENSATSSGIIEIEVIRSNQVNLEFDGGESLAPVTDFIITDNGIGFNDDNYESFNYAHSTYKIDKGGKGIGRITWLRAFNKAEIESVYRNNGSMMKRVFNFEPTRKGIENHENTTLATNGKVSRYTKVHLKSLKEEYQKWCNSKLEDISLKIIEHCFTYFLDENCPRIIIKDEKEQLVVNDLFGLYTRQAVENKKIKVKGNEFSLDIVKLYSPKPDNKIHYRAHKRDVVSEKITNHIPELQKFIEDENGDKFSIGVYVSGGYLDTKVNEERTEIGFSKTETLFPDDLKQEDISNEIVNVIRDKFKDYLATLSETRIDRVKKFVKDHPRYRYLLKYKKEALKGISSTIPDSKLEIELFKIQKNLETEVISEASSIMTSIEDLEQKENFNTEHSELYNKIIEVGNAKLSEYILHRKLVLKLLETHLKKSDQGKYSKEDSVHNLIFPLKKTSDDIALDEHNLWVIDERLAFHDYLASDRPFTNVERTASTSLQRADLLIFNKAHILNEDTKPYSSIVIVEFKRPMRDDYTEEENPINQINKYAREIINNDVLDKDGRPFDIREGTPLYAYIISDLTPKLRQFAQDQNYTLLPDNNGYFNFNRNYNLYVEIISFDKLISDSKKRNKILFEKLNLPTI
ncbi:hypothetical protein ED312_06735 [Sinomicrobium pectinilyticum]|uniref:ATP-binding protein n=1 Tax=Sinomicrobium pectinilyticum TaxID=1084421 RepID=A0A3N0EQD6_SINP1|nr:ATP-binding protein [Sinomicrobium pectinilyticum]RNL90115.1 hypothetical protein ED312_06735 [Sinomicrobium pectinilyticum]